MLEVKNIVKYYGDNKAVDDLSFTVSKGEIFGLLGENGAGKTTTFRIIMGLLDASSGEVLLDGKKIDYSVTDKIGFVTEERSLLTKMTVKEQIVFYGVLKGMSEDEVLKELDKWLERFDIKSYKDRKIKELSKGNQQKIQFISAVIHHPKLLILDEPFSGLDPINVMMLKNAIKELQEEGCAIIFSSHQMEYIEDFCSKLVILVKGKAIVSSSLKQLKKDYKKKIILLRGEKINLKELERIKGVLSIELKSDLYEIRIEDEKVAKSVFDKVKKYEISKYDVVEASLNEIFINKVGGSYE